MELAACSFFLCPVPQKSLSCKLLSLVDSSRETTKTCAANQSRVVVKYNNTDALCLIQYSTMIMVLVITYYTVAAGTLF
jgi:hypothetical protein